MREEHLDSARGTAGQNLAECVSTYVELLSLNCRDVATMCRCEQFARKAKKKKHTKKPWMNKWNKNEFWEKRGTGSERVRESKQFAGVAGRFWLKRV